MEAWKSVLPLLIVAALIAFEERLSVPSCSISGLDGRDSDHPDDLKVMMLADLLLQEPGDPYTDLFRVPYTSRLLRKSIMRLNPDVLMVLGDISAKGSELTGRKWVEILRQFHGMLGPFVTLPYMIVLGDRDIGECSKLDGKFVSQVSSNLPGLDSAGCSAFKISNISFLSLNAVAMLCGSNELRFGVEKVVERESLDLRSLTRDASGVPAEPSEMAAGFSSFPWRANDAASGSGPVVLLHFPLHPTTTRNVGRNLHRGHCGDSERVTIGFGPYERMQTLPLNATEYIFQSLKPRMVFSAHTHSFSDHTHSDGTREVMVPAMTWLSMGEPGFVLIAFRHNKEVVVNHCLLAKESHVLMAYLLMLLLIIATVIVVSWSYFMI